MVYADSEFCSVDTIRTLEAANVRYVIPSSKNKRVKREIERMSKEIEVRWDYGIYCPVSGSSTNKRASTNLVLLLSTKDEEKTVAFTTNKKLESRNQS